MLAGFSAAELLFQLGRSGWLPAGMEQGLLLGTDLVLLLLFAMGGRIVGSVTSGAAHRAGARIAAAHPRLEAAGLVLLGAMALSDAAMPWSWIGGALAGAAALDVAARLIRWRPWQTIRLPDLVVLHGGYAWLFLGLCYKAAAQTTGMIWAFEAVHVAMVGALGTLSLAIMARTVLQRARRPLLLPATILVAILLVNAATILRFLAGVSPWRIELLSAAAALWSAGFALSLVQLVLWAAGGDRTGHRRVAEP
jgi:uncharacterized protein involved in response to NO